MSYKLSEDINDENYTSYNNDTGTLLTSVKLATQHILTACQLCLVGGGTIFCYCYYLIKK